MFEPSPIIKILILFASIVALYRAKLPLWSALLIVSLASGMWFGAGPGKTVMIVARSSVAAETLFLVAVVVMIMGFSSLMKECGAMDRMVASVRELLGSDMFSAAALPAFIGLLPMPGGAIFSAPMVEASCGDPNSASPELKSAVNYWFRHVWEYWWPLYPGVILAMNLFGVPAWQMMLAQAPMTLAAVAGGYWFILRKTFSSHKKNGAPDGGAVKKSALLRRALVESASILIVIASIFIIGPVMQATGLFDGLAVKFLPVIAGFVLGIGWLAATGGVGPGKVAGHIFARHQLSMALLAVGVMVFRDVLVGVDAFVAAQADLNRFHVPIPVAIAALTFLSGLVMGLAIGFVGASFPLVISLIPPAAMAGDGKLAYLALAYTFGYIGMMLSPVHFCLILTKDYFKAQFGGIYRILIPPGIVVVATGLCAYFLYGRLFGN